jgi:hypothetical protein
VGSIPTAGIKVTTIWWRRFTQSLSNTFGVALGSHLGPGQVSLTQWDARLNGTKGHRFVGDRVSAATVDHWRFYGPVVRSLAAACERFC